MAPWNKGLHATSAVGLRQRAVRRLRNRLLRRGTPRLQMGLLVAAAASIGFLASAGCTGSRSTGQFVPLLGRDLTGALPPSPRRLIPHPEW